MVHCLVRPTQAIPYRGSERGREGRGREEGERGWERGWWERRERWRERVREGRTYLAPVSLTVTLLALHVGLLLGESHLLPSLDHLTSVSPYSLDSTYTCNKEWSTHTITLTHPLVFLGDLLQWW